METKSKAQGMVWGVLLILFGGVMLVETFTHLTAWVWVGLLAVAGLGVYGIYAMDRKERWMLFLSYALLAISLMVALIELNVLRDEGIATYVLLAIALPFFVAWLRDRSQWGLLIPAYVLAVIGVMVGLIGLYVIRDEGIATYVLCAIALPFLVGWLRDRKNWGLLIPAYVMVAIGVMVGLIGLRVLDDLLIPAYVMFAIAIPFLVVYVLDTKKWWALIPGGIMAVIGLAFLIAEAAVEYVAPAALIIVGIWVLVRQFTRKEEPAVVEVAEAPAELDAEEEVIETEEEAPAEPEVEEESQEE